MDLITLRQGSSVLVLQGAGMAAPFRGAVLPGSLATDAETTEQKIELVLEGTAAAIEGGLLTVGRVLTEAQQSAGIPGAQYVYLEARVTAGGPLARSLVLGGAVELLGGGADQRAQGTQGARITLTRANWWEGDEQALPLSNLHGSGVVDGLTVYNSLDDTHANYAELAAADAGGDLLSPVKLTFDGTGTDAAGILWAGQDWHAAAGLRPVVEGEGGMPGGGVTSADIVDATKSGGKYRRFSWADTAEVSTWCGVVWFETVRALGGRPVLPLVKLANGIFGAENFWSAWRITLSWGVAETVANLTGSYLPKGITVCPGAALALPPWPMDLNNPESPSMGLELRVQAAATGAHQLDIDYVFLLPLDGWRIYTPALTTWGEKLWIIDDPYRNVVSYGTWNVQGHVFEGPGLWVMPGRVNRYFFMYDRQNGGWGAFTAASVKMSYRPRRRVL